MDARESVERHQVGGRDGEKSTRVSSLSRIWQRVRIALWGGAGLSLALAVGFGAFAEHISFLTQPTEMPTADGIIVLTGGQSRLSAALDLLKEGKGKRLLISGVNPHAGRKALRVVTGSDKQLFTCCVDIDHLALDTVGNAEQSAKWVAEHDYGRVILVTNNYHMPRSLLEMHRLLPGASVEPYPVVNSRLDDGSWLTKPDALRVLATEYVKYLAALARSVLPANAPAEQKAIMSAAIE
ncbi:MAG: YdcF family protein [Hyphomicrobiales bacterium]|nr:YdcF family protein [Hyphomicrobiales bacterium]